jgi:putative phosphoribosyl transferase
MFTDRRQAGYRLLEKLGPLDPANTVVLALPRGGVPVADVIAEALAAPLDMVFVRKVGVPGHPELAVAAVTNGSDPKVTINDDVARMVGLDLHDISLLAARELPEIRRQRETYLREAVSVPRAGKTVLVVDDGLATGATMRAALRSVREDHPAHLIAAVPVAPGEMIAALEKECDDVICLECPAEFRAVGLHYRDFGQVSDEAVSQIVERHAWRQADEEKRWRPV